MEKTEIKNKRGTNFKLGEIVALKSEYNKQGKRIGTRNYWITDIYENGRVFLKHRNDGYPTGEGIYDIDKLRKLKGNIMEYMRK